MQLGSYQPSFQDISIINDILIPIKKEYLVKAQEKGIDFTIDCTVSYPVIWGDNYSIYQIFSNLIDNAIKYTNQGYVNIKIDKNINNLFYICIEDSGIGISEEFKIKLFEPFMQEERGYTRKFEGNGLGLALVKKYCDLNNLTISVESKKNVGSKFFVTFPKSITT
jgi:signal transduction histidine kinase